MNVECREGAECCMVAECFVSAVGGVCARCFLCDTCDVGSAACCVGVECCGGAECCVGVDCCRYPVRNGALSSIWALRAACPSKYVTKWNSMCECPKNSIPKQFIPI